VEAVEYFSFHFRLLSSKCFRFHKNFTVSASTSLPHVFFKCFYFRLIKKSDASEFASASSSLI